MLLGNGHTSSAVLIYWKSKIIKRVCKSPKDAETRNLNRLVDNARYMVNQASFVLFGKDEKEKVGVKFSQTVCLYLKVLQVSTGLCRLL